MPTVVPNIITFLQKEEEAQLVRMYVFAYVPFLICVLRAHLRTYALQQDIRVREPNRQELGKNTNYSEICPEFCFSINYKISFSGDKIQPLRTY